MTRLSRATLPTIPVGIVAPRSRSDGPVGVVHFGPGAFHRAHQADFFDRLLDQDPRWGIAAVSLRTRSTIDALAAQDGFYTLAIRDAASSFRVIGAHRRFLGPEDGAATLALLADPAVQLVTSTVTEKGYCLAADGTLDLTHPDIVHDLGGDAVPASLIGWLVAGLRARRAAGIAPFVPMPCDNLASNGAKLKAALIAFAAATDASLAGWIANEVVAPSTMVDSITPAADDILTSDVRAALGGLDDGAAVQREAFTQWVIEDIGHRLGPDLGSVGATITSDVAGYERAKLRILNGAHSTLAYAGLLRGHTSVAQAMGDPALAGFVDAMVRADITPTLPPVSGLDLDAYREAVMARFRNPAILHRLDQIAMDGSQKLPYRLGDTLAANRAEGRLPRHLLAALGCWIAFLVIRARDGVPIIDPAGDTLTQLSQTGNVRAIVDALAERGLGLTTAVRHDEGAADAIAGAAEAAIGERWDALGMV